MKRKRTENKIYLVESIYAPQRFAVPTRACDKEQVFCIFVLFPSKRHELIGGTA